VTLRMLCADVVEIHWKEKNGRNRRKTANLEDISPSGARLQVEHPVPPSTMVRIRHGRGELTGEVKYCVLCESGYFLGVEFEPDSRWSQARFRPRYLLNPRRLRS
jgi:hypothetical protein